MVRTLNWTESDWDLIAELLEREERQLPVEIRHTDSNAYKEQLRQRLMRVSQMLEFMRVTASAE
ncbi:MAG: hypothetical protein IT168_08965 [Bryobacterales bacterium]|nr:hypothetical protein [Bryobacterales bacterium]